MVVVVWPRGGCCLALWWSVVVRTDKPYFGWVVVNWDDCFELAEGWWLE